MDWQSWIIAGIPLLLTAAIGWAVARWAEPLREFKRIWRGNPIMGIIAAAIVMAAEMVWNEYDGAYQFDRACELLADLAARYGLLVSEEQVREIVQAAYEMLKKLLGERWDALKLGLAGQPAHTTYSRN